MPEGPEGAPCQSRKGLTTSSLCPAEHSRCEDNAGVIVNDKGEMKGSAIQAGPSMCLFTIVLSFRVVRSQVFHTAGGFF